MKETGQGNREPELIAVVGMAGRFPGARDVQQLWRNLRDGVESISFFSDEELLASGVDPQLLSNPNFVKARGTLEDYDCFDAAFFGFSNREAAVLDPQDRLFLECAWSALEDAGCDPESYPGAIGVFGGETLNTYLLFNLAQNPQVVQDFGWLQMRILNDRDFLTTQASYRLNLKGPSISVQTACSTSLVAVHLACESLLAYQSDVALAGGVSVLVPHRMGYLYREGGIASPDGHCRAFDAKAAGTIGGNGVGIVVLKRLEDALADGDTIRALIRSSAVNNDGSQKIGFTAPSVQAQSECIATALGLADVDAETVTYLEAHGTGTLMGDPVEIEALTEAFRQYTAKTGFCALGSIKTNIGHLDPAAGVAGLIKTVLALQHRQIPPSLHFERPNPEIDFENSPFYVNARLSDWNTNGTPRRAGVSSLGVGGTNAHVIVEEPPPQESAAPSRPWQLLALSAKSAVALEQVTKNLAEHLKEHPEIDFADAAYTLLAGRRHFEHRRVTACRNAAEAASALSGQDPQSVLSAQASQERAVAFLLPGQGAQYPGMARQLYRQEPIFQESLDRCCDFLRRESGLDLLDALYGNRQGSARIPAGLAQASEQIHQTALAQPLLFSIEYSLAQLWSEWEVRPQAMIGHSVGELTAACLAGVMDLEAALALVALRGRLMQSLPGGAMLSVSLPESRVVTMLGKDLWLAAVNAPSLCVVSGRRQGISALQEKLAGRQVECRRLHVSHAFHSAMMDPILAAFAEQVGRISLSKPQIPYLSNLTGDWIRDEEATDPDYWVRHIRQPVRFSPGAAALLSDSRFAFLEVGPGTTLTTLMKQQQSGSQAVAVPSLPGAKEDRDELELALGSLGRLWVSGVKMDPQGLYRNQKRRRIPLPTYPFERRRHWIESQQQPSSPSPSVQPGGWLTTRLWRQSPPAASQSSAERRRWLIVADKLGLAEELASQLGQKRHQIILAEAGDALAAQNSIADEVLYLAGLQSAEHISACLSVVEDLSRLTEALAALSSERAPIRLTVVTNGAYSPTGHEEPVPSSTALAAVGLALGRQVPGLVCRIVDPDLPVPIEARSRQRLAERLLQDLLGGRQGSEWAYHADRTWVRTPQAIPASADSISFQPRREGFYVLAASRFEAARQLALELAGQGARLLVMHCDTPDKVESEEGWIHAELDLSHPQQVVQAVNHAEEGLGKFHGFIYLQTECDVDTALREMTALSQAAMLFELDFGLFVLVGTSREGAPFQLDESVLPGWAEGEALRLSHKAGFPCSTLRLADASAKEISVAAQAVLASQASADFGVSLPDLRRQLAKEAPQRESGSLARLFTQIPFEAPRSPTEKALARIWEEVLGIAPVGLHDSFLELGGHSLLATQVTAKISRRLHIDLPTRLLSEAPTLAALAEAVSSRPRTETVDAELPAIVHDPDSQHEPFPLTDVQQAYWIGRSGAFDLGEVGTHYYLEIDSHELDVVRLQRAWQRLVKMHGMLRAVVGPDGRQHVLPQVPDYEIEMTQLSQDADQRHVQLDALRQRMSHQVLPSDRWPLFELCLARWPDGKRCRFYLSIDMLIADVRSFLILRRDLGLLYEDPEASLTELEVSFRDYVMAEQELRRRPLYLKALQYWRSRLDSLPSGPELPVLQPGLSAPRFQRRRGILEAEKWQCLKRRAARIGVSQPGLLMTIFSLVLAAWSKKPHFTLNLTLNNRLPSHPQVDEIVGDFTSLIPLEVDFRAPGTFEELARRLQKQLWSDLDHRHVSGVRVVRELAAHRRGGVSAALLPVVFTSALNMGSGRRRGNTVFGLPGQEAYSISQTPQVWLDHQVGESSDGMLVWNWDGVEELFPEGMLDAMMQAYQQLLDMLSEDEEAWQQENFVLIPFEDLELQELSNATEAPEAQGLLHQPILDQARRRPDQPAVISRQRTLSYRQLAQLSSGLGHCLRALKVRPDTLVAVVMEHGWEQVPAVLGILQSGAAYLPIDANLPHERLCYLLMEGQATIVLTQSWLESRLEWPESVQRISVDTFDPTEWPSEPPTPCQKPDDLAYVIFTSGSTGHPKGVMIEHSAALNTIADINQRFEIGPQDRILGVSALNFDLSVYDIFGLLAAGGALVVPDPDSLREPARWLDWIQEHQITFWNSVPALVEMLVEQAEAGRGAALQPLRLCLMSGDWIPPTLPRRLQGLNPEVQVISGGGATEASIWSILYPIGEVDPKWKSIPYGRPMANQRFYVLDRQFQPRPCWVPGELYIADKGLARGYWRDPQKTDAAFVHHPVSGQRLYRTGDLGRFLPDGNIEFLGREDTQVKVQGMRIELGEVEAALRSHPDVQAGVVEAVGELRGHKRLVGYVVPRGEGEGENRTERAGRAQSPERRSSQRSARPPSASSAVSPLPELRRFLATKLPQYMIPATFITLEALPLNPNGKVDRAALPSPDQAATGEQDTSAEPRNPVEEAVMKCWAERLAGQEFGIFDDFFQLGGDSLLATRVLLDLQEVFPIEIPLRTIFERPTIAELAEGIDELLLDAVESMPEEELQGSL